MNRQRSVAVGIFETRHQAQVAVGDLRRAGFREDEIGIIARNGESVTPHDASDSPLEHSRAVEGAAAGLATGAGVGALWALGIAAGILPAIGPVIAGGILASLAASAAGAAAVGTLVGTLIGLGIPEEEAEAYHAHFVEGRTIVTVKADQRYPEAVQILESHGGKVSFPYTVTDKTETDPGVVTRGTRPADVQPATTNDRLAKGMADREEAGAGGAGLGSRVFDRPINIMHPFSETLFDKRTGSRQASSSTADAAGEDVDEPRGTGEPIHPGDSSHFERLDRADNSDRFQQMDVGQRLDETEPVRASDQQTLGLQPQPLPAEDPTSDAASRSVRAGRPSALNPGEITAMPPGTTPAPGDRAVEFPGNVDRVSPTSGQQPDERSSERRTTGMGANAFDRPA